MQQLRPEIARLAKAKGISEETEIQKKAIPLILEGRDVLCVAPTGFGKTEAAVLPILSRMLDEHDAGHKEGIQAIYITPLKALNRDMIERLTFFCHMLGVRIAVRHGDTPSSERAKQRDHPPQFLVTTPETLQSLLVAPKLCESLVNVRFVVIDEVHELVESERGLQLAIGMERLRMKSPKFQTIGLSATVGSKEEVARFLSPTCVVVESGLGRELHVTVESPTKAKGFEELALGVESRARLERVKELIETHRRTLVFVNTRYHAESLGSLLVDALAEGEAAVHHSSLSKEARVETETEFKAASGKIRGVVCTSSLELGIDIGEIDLVVQFVSPRQATRLLQRVGRSGHRKHLIPKGVVIAGGALDCIEAGVVARRAKKGLLEREGIRKNALDVVGHQIAGLCLDFGKMQTAKAYEIITRAMPFSELDYETFLDIVRRISEAGVVLFDGREIAAARRTRLYYYENVSTIRDKKKYFVKDANTRKNVGVLDEEFVSEYLREGVSFIARGRAWRVMAVGEKELVVEPTRDIAAAIPEWAGEEIPVAPEVAQEVAKVFSGAELPDLDAEARKKVAAYVEEQKKFFIPAADKIHVEMRGEICIVHCFAGNKANEALGRVLAAVLSTGGSARVKASAYGVELEFGKRQEPSRIKAALDDLKAKDLAKILEKILPNTQLFRFKFGGVAKAFGIISKKAEWRDFSLKRLAETEKGSPVWKEALGEVLWKNASASDAQEVLRKSSIVLLNERDAWSPLAREFFELGSFGDLITPADAAGSKVLEGFKETLLAKRAHLECGFCKRTFWRSLKDAEEKIVCPYCGSNQVMLEGQRKTMTVVAHFGRRGLLALSTFGVGPDTAARILRKQHENEEALLLDLLEAQRNFIRTRQYWRI